METNEIRDILAKTTPGEWLEGQGAQVRRPTNPYEVLRFDAPGGLAMVWRNKRNLLNWSEAARVEYRQGLEANQQDASQDERKETPGSHTKSSEARRA